MIHNIESLLYTKHNWGVSKNKPGNLKFPYGSFSFCLLQIFPCTNLSFISPWPIQEIARKTCWEGNSFLISCYMNKTSSYLSITYFERLFDVSDTSHAEERGSTAFNFHFSTSSDPLPGLRPLYFWDHRVTVTRSSICTSLTSGFEELKLWTSTIGRMEGVDGEKEDLLGEEWQLPSGLIWVAMSLLETARDTEVAASFTSSTLSSVINPIKQSQQGFIIIYSTFKD